MVLCEEQLQQYRDEGYAVVRGLISAEEAGRVRERLMALREGEHDWPDRHFQVLDPQKFQNPHGGFVPVGVQKPAGQETAFQAVADHPNLQGAMSELLGGPVERYTDQALIKSQGISGQSFYHQDSYYWKIEPELGCNAWIALDEVGGGASALAIMPGSHRGWKLMEHERYFDRPNFYRAWSGDAFQRWRIPADRVNFSREVLLPMSVGDAAFFTNYTWHRSEPNRSETHKMAYAIAYQIRQVTNGTGD